MQDHCIYHNIILHHWGTIKQQMTFSEAWYWTSMELSSYIYKAYCKKGNSFKISECGLKFRALTMRNKAASSPLPLLFPAHAHTHEHRQKEVLAISATTGKWTVEWTVTQLQCLTSFTRISFISLYWNIFCLEHFRQPKMMQKIEKKKKEEGDEI